MTDKLTRPKRVRGRLTVKLEIFGAEVPITLQTADDLSVLAKLLPVYTNQVKDALAEDWQTRIEAAKKLRG